MWILSDQPDLVTREFNLSTTPAQPADLPAEIATAWHALAPAGAPPHIVRAPDDHPDRVIVFVDHAHRSQFDALRDALGTGIQFPRIICALARTGSGFHGNRSRPWSAVAGNLHFTAVIQRPLEISRVGAALSMLPVAAVAEMLEQILPARHQPEIKWVNDVLLGGRKVSGVLTATNLQGSTIEAGIFGIGLNVATIPELAPTAFVPAATRLCDWTDSPPPTLGTLTCQLLDRLEAGLGQIARHGPAEVLATYRRLARGIGRHVTIWPDDTDDRFDTEPLARGCLIAINDDLSLQLADHPEPVTRGRLAYAPEGPSEINSKH